MNDLPASRVPTNVCYLTAFIGDYHAPRLKRLAEDLDSINASLKLAQFNERSGFYDHAQLRRQKFLRYLDVTQFRSPKGVALIRAVWTFLKTEKPAHIFVLGYSDAISLTALAFAKLSGRRIYFMSDSKADDQPRTRRSEFVKKLIISCFDGALVAGKRHCDYFISLGFTKPIETGYDVVDNRYFAERAKQFSGKLSLLRRRAIIPSKYILCVSRLVHRKRVDRVLRIFADSGIAAQEYKLVVIGDGIESARLQALADDRDLSKHVVHIRSVANHFMPAFYAGASAIILGSEYDQWGLCINEAMACGVPAIVSSRCGVAHEIVHGSTGIVFDGDDIEPAVTGLKRIAADGQYASMLARACVSEMRKWDLDRFSNAAIRLMSKTPAHRLVASPTQ
jgi:glycosyltransferase involved in cell wall biosynthesis